ncbi:MAG: ArsR/SmtB family transcription factor [Fidelibacterota bacterium]
MDKKIYEMHAEVCKIMANPKRLEIINCLRDGEKNVSQLVNLMKIPKSNLSQHLKIMKNMGILSQRRDGVNVYYKISNQKVIKACDLMREVLLEQMEEKEKIAESLRRLTK